MTTIQGFPPLADGRSRILILGSMPGNASLIACRYYAHPQNAFWRIMGDLIGAKRELSYESKLGILLSFGIALWDVLASCKRRGSLDSAIVDESVTANDFVSFFDHHPRITHVFFNGAMAEKCFRKHVHHLLERPTLICQKLPSTSPAHASLTYPQKYDAWKVILPLLGKPRTTERLTASSPQCGQKRNQQ